jgi:hypothetical protein
LTKKVKLSVGVGQAVMAAASSGGIGTSTVTGLRLRFFCWV